MAFGPGKYDDLVSHIRGVADAEGVVLLIVNGSRGSGMSAQLPLAHTFTLPEILRDIARQIEEKGPDA